MTNDRREMYGFRPVLAALLLLGGGCQSAPPPCICPPVPAAPPLAPAAKPAEAAAAPSGPVTPAMLAPGPLTVESDAGKNAFTAIFDAPLGERITAQSSAVECAVTYDDKANSFSGSCDVGLTTVSVDGDSTKTEHFQQWATNKKSEPKDCKLEAKFEDVKLASPLMVGGAVKFAADIPFTVCGRARVDGGKEHAEGTALVLPADMTGGSNKALIVRAHIDSFSRDRYHIGPAYTDGWLARVQKLANVVSDTGNITMSLTARTKE